MITETPNLISAGAKFTPGSSEPAQSTPGDVKDTRAAYIQDKGLIPDHGDYSAWQRTPGLKSADSDYTHSTVSERPTSPETEIVRLQIKARRKTLQQYQKMQSKLVACNLELMGDIKDNEAEVHDEVTALLEQYDKFRGAIGTIRQQSEKNVKKAKELLNTTRETTSKDLAELDDQVNEIEARVLEKANEFEVLLKFKGTDKEYHLRAVKVSELRMELENLHTEQTAERNELAALVHRHHSNLNQSIDKRCKDIQASLTASAVKNIPDSLRELAQQNRVMHHEILLHKENVLETACQIDAIKTEIKKLQLQKRSRRSDRPAPKLRDVCTPETELTLDIATYQLLPV